MEQISGYEDPLDRSGSSEPVGRSDDGASDIHFSFGPDAYQQDTSGADSLGEAAGVSDQMCALEDLSPNPMAADVPYAPSISVAEASDWSRLDFEGFSAICARQEIVLPTSLHDAVSAPERFSIRNITEQSGMFAAIGAVASMRRHHPDRPLIEKPIDVSAFGNNVPALAIANMLNASLLIQDGYNIPDEVLALPSFVPGRKTISSCGNAEQHFANQLDSVPWVGRFGSVVFEEDGLPVFYRKRYGAESAITLTDVNVGGVVLGEGYIVRVFAECDSMMHPGGLSAWAADNRSLVYPTNEIIEVTPMRPSAYGLPPEQRAMYFPDEKPTSKQYTVDDFVRRSQEIVSSTRDT